MPKTNPFGARLAKLQTEVVTAKQRQRQRELASRAAEAEMAQLKDARIEALAIGDETRAAKVDGARAMAEAAAKDAAERLQAARLATARAESDVAMFAHENLDGLIAEQTPDAVNAARGLGEALVAVGTAHSRWQHVNGQVMGLLRLAGLPTHDVPDLAGRLVDVVRDARRAGGIEVPVPVPGGLNANSRERNHA